MKIRVPGIRVLILAVVLAAVPAAAFSSEQRGFVGVGPDNLTVPGRLCLLAIGIDDYLHWPKLRTPANDVRAFAQILTARYGFSRENINILYNQDATESNIEGQLRRFARELTPSDSLVIFYAGHGILDKLTGRGSWIPVDGSREDTATWIKNSNIKEILAAIKARHILLISDSCFAGDIFRGTFDISAEKGEGYARSVFSRKSRLAMTSGGLEPVTDEGPDNHSIFAYHLLTALENNPKEQILTSELFARIEKGLRQDKVSQQPILDVLRKTGSEPEGQFVFFKPSEPAGLAGPAIEPAQAPQGNTESQKQEIAQKKAQLESLQTQIDEIRKAQQRPDSGQKPSLDQIYEIALQKQRQAQEIARLNQAIRRAEEKKAREQREAAAALAASRKKAFYEDYYKYLKIMEVDDLGMDFKRQAWQEICDAWQVSGAGSEPGYFKWQDNRPVLSAGRGGNPSSQPMVLGSSDLVEPGGWYGEINTIDASRGLELGDIVEPGGYFGEVSSRMRGTAQAPIPEPGGEYDSGK